MLGQLQLWGQKGESLRQAISVEVIPNSGANKVSLREHYLHRIRTGGRQLSHGIFYQGEMVGIFVWASPTFHKKKGLIPPLNQNEVVELARMWLSDKAPKLSETAALGKSLRRIVADWQKVYDSTLKVVVSFSDLEVAHEGVIYKAANFEDWGFAPSARLADVSKRYSRTKEPWQSGHYAGGGTEIAPRSSTTKRLWVYWLDKQKRRGML